MKSPHGDCYQPTALEIAAFLDGELDRQAHLAALRRRIQEYLLDHPQAGAAALAQRRLKLLMHATGSPEPAEDSWNAIQAHLEKLPAPAAAVRPPWWSAAGVVAAAVLLAGAAAALVAVIVWPAEPLADAPTPPAPARVEIAKKKQPDAPPQSQQTPASRQADLEPFPVATADEIEILSIGGADVKSVFVRHFPMNSPLPIPEAGEVTIRRAEREVRMEPTGRPVIWVHPPEEDPDPDPN